LAFTGVANAISGHAQTMSKVPRITRVDLWWVTMTAPREIPVNRWPVNQAAVHWLREANDLPDPHLPYLVQLLHLGFEREQPVPGLGDQYRGSLELAAGKLLSNQLDPVKVTRLFQDNPNGPDQDEQSRNLVALLTSANSWEQAAQSLMELWYDLNAAANPYYQPAASEIH
jgi:hypothetical protein